MSEIKPNFGALPESQETQYVREAGIHMKFKLISKEFVARTTKDNVDKQAYVKLTFSDGKKQYTTNLFEPPYSEEKVKWLADVYKDGVAIRKNTPAEQIEKEFYERFYFFEQLARALAVPREKIEMYKKSIGGETIDMFKLMFDQFFTMFPLEMYKDKFINFKLQWNNNIKTKESYLQLCKATANNVVFATYVNDETPVLQLNANEEKSQKRQFSPQDRKPKNDNTEAGDWKPIPEDNAEPGLDSDKPLF